MYFYEGGFNLLRNKTRVRRAMGYLSVALERKNNAKAEPPTSPRGRP
jgi:hypothetical protein